MLVHSDAAGAPPCADGNGGAGDFVLRAHLASTSTAAATIASHSSGVRIRGGSPSALAGTRTPAQGVASSSPYRSATRSATRGAVTAWRVFGYQVGRELVDEALAVAPRQRRDEHGADPRQDEEAQVRLVFPHGAGLERAAVARPHDFLCPFGQVRLVRLAGR